MPKIVVYGADDAALLALETAAQQRQIPNSLIRDAGRTIVPAGTVTCIGLGPAPRESIDALTGTLPLV
jgi:peptidyl-tRNA hydrolase